MRTLLIMTDDTGIRSMLTDAYVDDIDVIVQHVNADGEITSEGWYIHKAGDKLPANRLLQLSRQMAGSTGTKE